MSPHSTAVIGRASLACENKAEGCWGQEVHIHTGLCFGCNNRTVLKLRFSVILSEGLLQA